MVQVRRGFSLVELMICFVVLTLLGFVLVPSVHSARNAMRGLSSAQKLMAIGQGGMMYAADNKERLFGYNWRAGEVYTMPDGRPKVANSDQNAAAYQNQEILQRRTGRISGFHKIMNYTGRIPHRRHSHLVLMDYMNEPFGSDLFIDPSDVNQQHWKDNPLEYGDGSGVPYTDDVPAGYDTDPNWPARAVRQRWAFASSYQVVPDAWQPEFGPRYIPVHDTPHLFIQNGSGQVPLANGRRLRSVLHTANKVWMHEEFDRDRQNPLYFGYDDAQVEKLMFDGSVNSWASGIAAPSVVPEYGIFHWKQAYVPLDQFPVPMGGLGDSTEISQRFRWTFGGLTGINYGPFSFD
ncbi:MAG: type II secretion system protein [Phycisphaerales bacterium]